MAIKMYIEKREVEKKQQDSVDLNIYDQVPNNANPANGANINQSHPTTPLMKPAPPVATRNVYLQFSTKNRSFVNMHEFLKAKGIKNNAFMLLLYDPDLAKINPRDPNLPFFWQQRVLRECLLNYWYFIREIVRIPQEGGDGEGSMYQLHRGNLAYNFCSIMNLNTYQILPRQKGKTIGVCVRYLYLFNFGTTYSSMYLLNQQMDKAKENLQRIKNLRAMLPSYLRMDQPMGAKGLIKASNSVEKLEHVTNGNLLKVVPSARNKINAANLIRGKTIPLLWFDEFAFIPFVMTVYLNGVPAHMTAAANAAKNGKAHSITITTTPGNMNTEEGKDAYEFMNDCTVFTESFYDMSYKQIMNLVESNKRSNFIFIQFSYKQLGESEKWFENICAFMKYRWDDIRREVLLEWSINNENCPFTKEELDTIMRYTVEPVKTIMILDQFPVEIYHTPEYISNMPKYPPIIGVDPAGAMSRDYSAMTIIDSYTTKVIATFHSNHIEIWQLAQLIHEIVKRYMPNAVVNIEANGGFGLSLIGLLLRYGDMNHNLYWELREKVIEQNVRGAHRVMAKTKKRSYGFINTKDSRNLLMDILRWRVREHKKDFLSKDIYNELCGMEIKKSGKIEHSDATHDDVTFSYLMAMYVWKEGKNLSNWRIDKHEIKNDEDFTDEDLNMPNLVNVFKKYPGLNRVSVEDGKDGVSKVFNQLNGMKKSMGMTFSEWEKSQYAEDDRALDSILMTKPGKEAYAKKVNMNPEDIKYIRGNKLSPMAIMKRYYSDPEDELEAIHKRFNLANMKLGER